MSWKRHRGANKLQGWKTWKSFFEVWVEKVKFKVRQEPSCEKLELNEVRRQTVVVGHAWVVRHPNMLLVRNQRRQARSSFRREIFIAFLPRKKLRFFRYQIWAISCQIFGGFAPSKLNHLTSSKEQVTFPTGGDLKLNGFGLLGTCVVNSRSQNQFWALLGLKRMYFAKMPIFQNLLQTHGVMTFSRKWWSY